MKLPTPLFIALRYTRSKERKGFVSFISLAAVLGIALGIMVLLTVLSVMNGFQKEIRERMLSLTAPLTLQSHTPINIETWSRTFHHLPPAISEKPASPLVEGQVMFLSGTQMTPVLLKGIDPKTIDSVLPISKHLNHLCLSMLKPDQFQVILGQDLADRLHAQPGDTIVAVLPQAHVGLAGMLPRVKRLTVAGTFSVEYLYDSTLAFLHIEDAAQLLHQKPIIDAIQIALSNPFDAPSQMRALQPQLPEGLYLQDWTSLNQSYFKAVQTEKTMMFLILTLLIAIAAFNLVSMLVMTVTDKKGDIAILRAMGATKTTIMHIFMIHGVLLGAFGVLLGGILGYVLSHHVTEVVQGLEQLSNIHFLDKDLYFIDFLPSDFQWMDAAWVLGISFSMSFLATLYPAWKAASVWPAEVLRHD